MLCAIYIMIAYMKHPLSLPNELAVDILNIVIVKSFTISKTF
jgi:hypothetical protein